MNSPADILVLSEQPEKVANLNFLLRLSNYRTIPIDDDIEALNFLIYRQNSQNPVRLLLVVNAKINQPILQFLDELERRNALLPILLLRDGDPLSLDNLPCNPQIKKFLKQCDPSITFSCIKELLNTFSAPVARVS